MLSRIVHMVSITVLLFMISATVTPSVTPSISAFGNTLDNRDTGGPAPRFNAKTVNGEFFNNESIKGKVVLVQFWTTWCQYCRKEQPIVDSLAREFEGEDLIVLGVNVGESKNKVRQYLAQSPRDIRIVLNDDTNLPALYATKSFPLYVLIDKEGKVAGMQPGAAGESSLRGLLRRAGVGVYTTQISQNWKSCQSDDPDIAISGCSAVIQLGDENASGRHNAYYNRGLAYHDKKMSEEAIADFTKAIKFDAKDAATFRARGIDFARMELYEKAITDYSKAVELDPKDAASYRYRGLAYENIGQRDKAIEDYRKSLAIAPNSKFALEQLKRLGVQP